jgi:hypothetical protein
MHTGGGGGQAATAVSTRQAVASVGWRSTLALPAHVLHLTGMLAAAAAAAAGGGGSGSGGGGVLPARAAFGLALPGSGRGGGRGGGDVGGFGDGAFWPRHNWGVPSAGVDGMNGSVDGSVDGSVVCATDVRTPATLGHASVLHTQPGGGGRGARPPGAAGVSGLTGLEFRVQGLGELVSGGFLRSAKPRCCTPSRRAAAAARGTEGKQVRPLIVMVMHFTVKLCKLGEHIPRPDPLDPRHQ